MEIFEKVFKLKENDTTIMTETVAGITIFMTMSYIIFVNPTILAKTGMDFGAVMMATVLASGFTTILTAYSAHRLIYHPRCST